MKWNGNYALIDPEAYSITFLFLVPSEYAEPASSFDGYVITGFGREIAAVSATGSGIGASASHDGQSIALDLSGNYQSGAGVVLTITFRP